MRSLFGSWEQIYSLYLATQNISLHLQHNSVVEYKIFNSPLAASPPPQRFGASLLIMKKYKIIVKDKKTGSTMQNEEVHSLLTKGRIVDNLKAKYRFHPNVVVIDVQRIVNKGGKQLDIFDLDA